MEYKHIPVMLAEIIEYLEIKEGGFYIDCTLGGAGYTFAIADLIGPSGKVLAIDLDDLAIKNTKMQISELALNNILVIQDNFRNLKEIAKNNLGTKQKFDGVVLDLGLSSAQLDDRKRGVSFKNLEAPINMAFRSGTSSTYDILNNYSENSLYRIIREYGEERFAKNISKNIIKKRKSSKIAKVGDLIKIIESSIPKKFRQKNINQATKTFQALRIETNKELENLKLVLPQVVELLKKGGRLVVVSYHSLEDRIVKNFFKNESRECICPEEVLLCECNHKPNLKIVTKKIVTPKEFEIKKNKRARSAKMRVAQKL